MKQNPLTLHWERLTAPSLTAAPEIERFGMEGEEIIARLLSRHFDCVIRNVVVPHRELYLEKDFLVICQGVPFVLEIKNWKGDIVCEGGSFYQLKAHGVRKKCKDPVGTTRQFISRMKQYYGIERPVFGAVVFAEPDCTLSLEREMDGVALLYANELVDYIQKTAQRERNKGEAVDPDKLLRCTRIYNRGKELCKGLLANLYLVCYAPDGSRKRIDTTRLKYLTVRRRPFRLSDKLYITYQNGETAVFYNRNTVLTLALLDGSFCKVGLNKLQHIVF